MRISKVIQILIISSLTLCSGCLTVSKYSYSLDFNTGEVEIISHDIRSSKGFNEKDYSAENDWAYLKEFTEDKQLYPDGKGSDYGPDVIEVISKELFQENDVLSGKIKFRIKCPECFSSKDTLLAYAFEYKNKEFKMLNDEIFFFLSADKNIISSNGKIIKTDKNIITVWPGSVVKLTYTVAEEKTAGVSLLPFHLKEIKSNSGGRRFKSSRPDQ